MGRPNGIFQEPSDIFITGGFHSHTMERKKDYFCTTRTLFSTKLWIGKRRRDIYGVKSVCKLQNFFLKSTTIALSSRRKGRCTKYVASKGGGGILLLRTPLHKCDVIYVVSPAYKGGSKSPEILRTYVLCACSLKGKILHGRSLSGQAGIPINSIPFLRFILNES